ncbi:MAG: NUDIX domain-containing protein [Caldilineaceae bacterium]
MRRKATRPSASARGGHVDADPHPRIAIGIFTRGTELLVFQGYDTVKGSFYYRPLGGGVEPGERAADALRREIRENWARRSPTSGCWTWWRISSRWTGGRPRDCVCLPARFVDPAVYAQETLIAHEDNGDRLTVIWRGLDSFDAQHRLVPPELFEVVGGGVLGN